MIRIISPAVIKILGEHAVVYGRLSVAAAISLYAEAEAVKNQGKYLEIRLEDLNATGRFDMAQIRKIGTDYKNRESISAYIEDEKEVGEKLLPFVTIAARIASELKMNMEGITITVRSHIPVGKGLASSAATSTAFAVCLLNEYFSRTGKTVESDMIIDIARDGERVVHKNENAGKIDVSTSYFGGIVSYSTASGAKREDVDHDFKMLLIDTGPKKSTAETVGHVAELYNKKKQYVEKILGRINRCSNLGLNAMKKGDYKMLGKYMFIDHSLLRKLGVSSERLDEAVEVTKKGGAYGAKLSGGGGGGIAIAITDKENGLIERLSRLKMHAEIVNIAENGASSYLIWHS